MAHGHHHHGPHAHDRAFGIGITVNLLYVLLEVGFGLASSSMALLSDAGHNLGDVLALALAWGASRLARAAPTERRTYGMKRATVLASLVSAVLLCLALGAVVWESATRLAHPVPTSGMTVVVVAMAGVIVNAFTAAMFMADRDRDLNIRSAYLHMAADAAVSLGVAVAGIVIALTGLAWVDPAVALVVSAIILASGYGLLRESLDLAMDAVPRHVDLSEVRAFLESVTGVSGVHHLHIWGMSTTETALTVHLVVDAGHGGDRMLHEVSQTLRQRFAIQHPTIQVEHGQLDEDCVYGAGLTADPRET